MIAAAATLLKRRRTIIKASARNVIQQAIGLPMDLTITVKMIASRAIQEMRRITTIRVSVRTAIIRAIHGQLQTSAMQDLTIVSPATRTINQPTTTQGNVPTAIPQAAPGQTRILITAD
jgi:hypothetical protein